MKLGKTWLPTASKRVLILRTWSLIRTFLAFWVLFGSLSQSLGVLISFGGRDTVRYRETSKIESWARIIIALGFTKTNCFVDIKCIGIEYTRILWLILMWCEIMWEQDEGYIHWELGLPEIIKWRCSWTQEQPWEGTASPVFGFTVSAKQQSIHICEDEQLGINGGEDWRGELMWIWVSVRGNKALKLLEAP